MDSLVNYSDSEEDGEVTEKTEVDHDPQQNKSGPVKHKLDPNREDRSMPLPSAIKMLGNGDVKRRRIDNPDEHGGRIRSFEHVEGNWATHVNIPYEPDERIKAMIEEMILCLRPLEFTQMEELHVSLSRTVVIRHHWIQPLTDSLTKKLRTLPRTYCELQGVKIYTNDEKTRTFIAIEVASPSSVLQQYVKVVDECFAEYRLQKYYEKPSFHISIAWSLGDMASDVRKNKLEQLREILKETLEEDSALKVIYVDTIQCKTGNKVFSIPLQT